MQLSRLPVRSVRCRTTLIADATLAPSCQTNRFEGGTNLFTPVDHTVDM